MKWTRRDLLRQGVAAALSPSLMPADGPAAQPSASRHESPQDGPDSNAPEKSLSAMAEPSRALLDFNWRFALGHASDPARDFGYGAAARERSFAKAGHVSPVTNPDFDDSLWSAIDLPHDWAVELPFNSAKPLPEQGARPIGREYPETSVGWYRRKFSLDTLAAEQCLWLEFEGIMRQADIFLNGHYLATHFSGYAPLTLDITDWANIGGENTLVVRCDVSLGEGWFYEGAGIYRHVWLLRRPKVHLVPDGTYARATFPAGSKGDAAPGTTALLHLSTEVRNATDSEQLVRLSWDLLDPEGNLAASLASPAQNLAPWAEATLSGQITIPAPHLWSIQSPKLYQIAARLHATPSVNSGPASPITDLDLAPFGFRSCRFDAQQGFFLNGRPLKIQGTCNHQDHAGIGSALPDRIHAFRIERLKSMGSNAYRTAHNCPAPALIAATDRQGMLVLCETRMMDAGQEGLSQLAAMIRKFRNHPSILLWSMGNEEPEQANSRGVRAVASMKRLVRQLDPSRPITLGMNGNFGEAMSQVLDVQGFNYWEESIDEFHREFPNQPILGTETNSGYATRGIYVTDEAAGYASAYDVNAVFWGKTDERWWTFYATRPFLSGGFAWTGFDYRGEPTPFGWPCVSSHFGALDTCGFAKDNYYYYKAWWGAEPVLHLYPDWNWRRGQQVSVWAQSNLDEVELLLNGQSLGRKPVRRYQHLEWLVDYEPGKIEARGYKNGQLALAAMRETTGKPAQLSLKSDRDSIAADGQDVSILTVEVQDAQGRLVPSGNALLRFEISGPGKLIGLGNGDPSCHEPDKGIRLGLGQGLGRSAFNGLAMALVQSTREPGLVTIQVSAEGLAAAEFHLNTLSPTRWMLLA